MVFRKKLTGAVGLALIAVLTALPARAQPSIGFAHVSRAGADTEFCGPTDSPCRTFQYAFSRTVANGSILCLDSGVFGPVVITRSVTIDCARTGGRAQAALGFPDAVTIDDSAAAAPGTANVVLRGLLIEDLGSGTNGIAFRSGGSLALDNVAIANFAAVNSNGILFTPALAARLHIANSIIANSGGGNGAGLNVLPSGPGYAAVSIDNVQFIGNRAGLQVDTGSASGSSTNLVISRGTFAGNQTGIAVTAFDDKPGVGLTLLDSTVNGSALAGLNVRGSNALVRLSRSTVSGNSTGLDRSFGGVIASYGNNALIGNGVNGAFNGFPTEN